MSYGPRYVCASLDLTDPKRFFSHKHIYTKTVELPLQPERDLGQPVRMAHQEPEEGRGRRRVGRQVRARTVRFEALQWLCPRRSWGLGVSICPFIHSYAKLLTHRPFNLSIHLPCSCNGKDGTVQEKLAQWMVDNCLTSNFWCVSNHTYHSHRIQPLTHPPPTPNLTHQ